MIKTTPSRMAAEVAEIPVALERLLRDGADDIRAAAHAARALSPAVIATVARGSSDQAASYFKYAAELTLGLPVASIGPSVASIYGAQLHLQNAVCIAVSQSGASPDIVEMARSARASGALTLAVTNDRASRLAETCAATLDIHAGPEISVAATKTFVTSVAALLALIAEWKGDPDLKAALQRLPEQLARAAEIDWAELRAALAGASSLYTLGRGPAFAISGEAALKFKEISQIHAENYSSAEVLHGPVSIVGQGFPVLAFAARDAAETVVAEIADQLAAKGAQVLITSDKAKTAGCLPFVATGHPLTDPLALIITFYATVERFARDSGVDPDKPRHLRKITETI
ncbi:MAG TPA: SIS domain-containing protein [Paracoccaceae bacterium]|nr:SIS domain-containing protein [Paracoccaceae bacterium]